MFISLKKINVALRLGLLNCLRLFKYKLLKKFRVHDIYKGNSDMNFDSMDDFFIGNYTHCNYQGNERWINGHSYFGSKTDDLGIPDWHRSCLTNVKSCKSLPWTSIPDFDSVLGDIKGVWEASRFEWVICFAQQIKGGKVEYLAILNDWIHNWLIENPPYKGANWKCGQEASIRVLHLCLAYHLLGKDNEVTSSLVKLLKAHLERIELTIGYAIAQDNNHGTSEASALFIGGSLLALNNEKNGEKWCRLGRAVLEGRIKRLVSEDGSFSQNSVNYHRLMLDTCSFVEFWKREYCLTDFSKSFYKKLQSASIWLYYFTDEISGDVPNMGSNDGAYILALTNSDYRDYRPSVQLACHLFLNKAAYIPNAEYDDSLKWLNIPKSKKPITPSKIKDFSDGGYFYLKSENFHLYLRYPNFKFRPSQCDALHLDLWYDGLNILRDAGSFSYNGTAKSDICYRSVASHNTVEFDSSEQMERLGRFLYYDWLKYNYKIVGQVADGNVFSVGYSDRKKRTHRRELSLITNGIVIKDYLSNFETKAVSRFRLLPVEWNLIGSKLVSDYCEITFSSDIEISRFELINGFESKYYYKEMPIQYIEIEIGCSGTLITEIKFK